MEAWSKDVFAKNLKMYMERRNLTQRDLAEITGVTQPIVHAWLQAKKFPRIDKIDRMADYFGILKSDLIEDKTGVFTMEKDASADRRKLIDLALSVPDEKVELLLRVMKSIVEDGK